MDEFTNATRGALWKKMFLDISQNSLENTSVRVSFLIRLQAWGLQLYWKRDSDTGVFLWICEISKKTFFTEHSAARKSFLVEAVHHILKEVVIMCSFYFFSLPHFKVTLMQICKSHYMFGFINNVFGLI